MKALQLAQPSASPEAIQVRVVSQQMPTCGPTEAIVRVLMAAINPSDVKASLGHMPQAIFPRTPGRDYVGIVEQGPKEWLGKTVFGSGGDVGITRNGSHAAYLVLPQRALLEKPAALTLKQAACMGVPYVTALDGFTKTGFPQPGEKILIGGAMGKVGLAATAIAKVYGARVIGIKRKETAALPGHACDALFNLEDPDLSAKLMEETQQRGFHLFYNTVGSPYLALSLDVLAHKGKQILISTLQRDCPFDIFKFFRKEMTFYGVDTLKKDTVASNQLLAKLETYLASGRLHLLQENMPKIYTLDQAAEAFEQTFVKGGIGLLNISAP